MKTKSMLATIVVSIFLLLNQAVESQGQTSSRQAVGGGSSSKTKAQADEMLRNGIEYKDGDEANSQTSSKAKKVIASNSFGDRLEITGFEPTLPVTLSQGSQLK